MTTAPTSPTIPHDWPADQRESPVTWVDPASQRRRQWEPYFEQLRSWLRRPQDFVDDGIDVPRGDVIERALLIAKWIISNDTDPPPTRTTPTAEGGISLEWRNEDELTAIEISPDGTAEILLFRHSRLVERQPLHLDKLTA